MNPKNLKIWKSGKSENRTIRNSERIGQSEIMKVRNSENIERHEHQTIVKLEILKTRKIRKSYIWKFGTLGNSETSKTWIWNKDKNHNIWQIRQISKHNISIFFCWRKIGQAENRKIGQMGKTTEKTSNSETWESGKSYKSNKSAKSENLKNPQYQKTKWELGQSGKSQLWDRSEIRKTRQI